MTEPATRDPAALDCAVATPVDRHGNVDTPRLHTHLQWLADQGCVQFALFGTTGEGPSFTVDERRAALEALLARGVDPGRLIVGTGCAAPGDTLALSRHAAGHGCSACLVLPPYFFRDPPVAGLERVFAEVLDALAGTATRLIAYHIPTWSGVALDPAMIARLSAAYPRTMAGVKDSGADWEFSAGLLARFPDLDIYIGAEPHVARGVAAGSAGTISGLSNFAPALVARMIAGDAQAPAAIDALLAAVLQYPLVPAIKALVATVHDDAAWLDTRLPLVGLERAAAAALAAAAGVGAA